VAFASDPGRNYVRLGFRVGQRAAAPAAPGVAPTGVSTALTGVSEDFLVAPQCLRDAALDDQPAGARATTERRN